MRLIDIYFELILIVSVFGFCMYNLNKLIGGII